MNGQYPFRKHMSFIYSFFLLDTSLKKKYNIGDNNRKVIKAMCDSENINNASDLNKAIEDYCNCLSNIRVAIKEANIDQYESEILSHGFYEAQAFLETIKWLANRLSEKGANE